LADQNPKSAIEQNGSKIRASLELMRPANIVTAFSDILAGFAAAGGALYILGGDSNSQFAGLGWLLVSTFGLYGGGVVMNDVFDAKLDADERPERPIPSGRISKSAAIALGLSLLLIGVLSASLVNFVSAGFALVIALCALIYDYKAKHSVIFGPLFMGLCRSGNLLLGMSIIPLVIFDLWPLLFIPLFYIGSITLISQGEVKGGNSLPGFLALMFIFLIVCVLLFLSILPDYQLFPVLPFVLLFTAMVLPPFWNAAVNPVAIHNKKAVKRGVVALIVLNSTIAAGFGGFFFGLIVVLLLPFSFLLSKMFAVT
jgi:4-hydroxybenzoate polyprenyltransferase